MCEGWGSEREQAGALRKVVLDVGLAGALGDVGNEEVLGGLSTTSTGRRGVVSTRRRRRRAAVALLRERLGVLGELHRDLASEQHLAILVGDGI